MEYLVSAWQMKQYDRNTIEQIGLSSAVLMERAALSVVDVLFEEKFPLEHILVICGSGNNGGDGFAAARLLDERGVRVTVGFAGRETSMSEECRKQREICEKCGIKISSNFTEHEYTTIVDAILGIGLSRAVEGTCADVIDWINHQSARKLAIDIPSGVDADTGQILGRAVRADATVTFAYRKIGQILYPGAEYCGRVLRRDIGVTFSACPSVFTYAQEDLERIARRREYSNKGTYGKVLLIAGSDGMSGAACLCARAAYRSGSGLVRVFTPECNRAIVQMYLPEAIVTPYTGTEDALAKLPELFAWSDVAGIGPGLGREETAEELVQSVLSSYDKPLVIDADALNLLAEDIQLLETRYQSFGKGMTILTPHIGEMMRLCGKSKEMITEDLLYCAQSMAEKFQLICALKDARTIVSDGKKSYINTSGNHGMAVGGAGDVLTGIICGLLAQKMPVFEAAALGVYVHGLSGDEAAKKNSAYAMLAGDIAESLCEVMKLREKLE